MMGENIRKWGFWILDYLKGKKIKKHYDDINDIMNENKNHLNILPHLLNYVNKNVSYYEKIQGQKLTNFPVVNKRIIMNNYEAFKSNEYTNEELHWVSTSGSTGTPFRVGQNVEKRNRTIADLLYFHKENGWDLGDRYIFLRAWTSGYNVSKAKILMQNFIPVDVIDFDDKSKEEMRIRLKEDEEIKIILGYASSLGSFVNFLENKNDNSEMFNVKVIFTASDNLSDLTKKKLENMFSCPVINRYSNEEFGVLACTSKFSNTFQLNIASYYFELLKLDNDQPVESGEVGRLVVTDLYNKSMPLIRYDTGDLAISNDIDKNQLRTVSSLEGRSADTIRTVEGKVISSVMVNNYLHEFYKIKQYQLIKEDENKYIFLVVCNQNDYSKDILIKTCKMILGKNSIIKIRYVNKILLEKTGKYKTIVDRYDPKH